MRTNETLDSHRQYSCDLTLYGSTSLKFPDCLHGGQLSVQLWTSADRLPSSATLTVSYNVERDDGRQFEVMEGHWCGRCYRLWTSPRADWLWSGDKQTLRQAIHSQVAAIRHVDLQHHSCIIRQTSSVIAIYSFLWPPYVIGGPLYFCPVISIYLSSFFFLLPSFFSSPNLSGRRLDLYHTSTHGVALVRI